MEKRAIISDFMQFVFTLGMFYFLKKFNNFLVFLCINQILKKKKFVFSLTWYLQSIQQDYTTLLSCLIQTFPNQPEFKDLVQLTDCHDPEMDFFENMKHIQVEDSSFFFPLSPFPPNV